MGGGNGSETNKRLVHCILSHGGAHGDWNIRSSNYSKWPTLIVSKFLSINQSWDTCVGLRVVLLPIHYCIDSKGIPA